MKKSCWVFLLLDELIDIKFCKITQISVGKLYTLYTTRCYEYILQKEKVKFGSSTYRFVYSYLLVTDGSLYKANCDFETPIPQNIGVEYILVLSFLAVQLRSKRACILAQLAADIFVVMASKNCR